MRAFSSLFLAIVCSASPGVRADPAAGFPAGQAIKIVVPFTSGSGADSSARFMAEKLARQLDATVIVDNKPGANGVLAVQAVRAAPADGHTILLASNSIIAVNQLLIKALAYDPVQDLQPIGSGLRSMNVLVTGAHSPLRTLEGAISASHARADGLTLGTYSAGYMLVARWLGSSTGLKFSNIPYKGGAATMTDVAGGSLDLALVDSSGALALIQAGKLHPIAVTGATRHPLIDAPTVRESGYKDFVQYSWTSFYVDAKTPAPSVARLNDALRAINASAESREYAKTTGGELMALDAAAMRRWQLEEIARFRRIAQQAGIEPR